MNSTLKSKFWCELHHDRCKNFCSMQFFFLRKVVRQNGTDVTSLFMELEKVQRGLLREAFQSEREWCSLREKRGGFKRKDGSWKTQVNIGVLLINKKWMQRIQRCNVFNPPLFPPTEHSLSFPLIPDWKGTIELVIEQTWNVSVINKYCKYYCVVLSSFGETDHLTILND